MLSVSDKAECDNTEDSQCLQFHFRHQQHNKKLVQAGLWLYLSPVTGNGKRTIVASLPANRYGDRYVLGTKETYRREGWIEIELFQRHTKKHFTELLNFIEITHSLNSREITSPESSLTPILSLTYAVKTRARRQSGSARSCNSQTNCCLRDMALSLDDLGWDWVEAPRFIRVSYCEGNCGSLHLGQYENQREQLMSIYQSTRDIQLVSACCVPTSYDSFPILYQRDDGVVQQTTLSNITALSCGCIV